MQSFCKEVYVSIRSINTSAYQNRKQSAAGPETCKKHKIISLDLVAARGCAYGVNVRSKQSGQVVQ
jgi:hypothetical protein